MFNSVYPLKHYENYSDRSYSIIVRVFQDQVDAAVKQLLALKAEYKQVTGQDYKPSTAPVQQAPAPVQSSPSPASAATGLYERVAEQGEVVRRLKTAKASKVRPHIHLPSVFLLSLFFNSLQMYLLL